MFSRFPRIKGPPRRLARTIQAYLRHYWNVFVRVQNDSRSWFESNILPLWTFSVSVFHLIAMLFRNAPPPPNSTDETTPLLEDNTSIAPASNTSNAPSVRSKPLNIRGGVPVRPLEIRVNPILDSPQHVIPHGTFYFSVDPYCVICRKNFHCKKDDLPESQLKWDRQFIASKFGCHSI